MVCPATGYIRVDVPDVLQAAVTRVLELDDPAAIFVAPLPAITRWDR